MENKKRPVAKMLHPAFGFSSWIFPEFLDLGAKIFKNHKMQNTAGMLIWIKTIKKLQKNEKSENVVFFYDSRERSTRRLGVNRFFENIHSRATDDTKSKIFHVFSWDDQGFLFLGTWKTHFLFLKFVFVSNAIMLWQQNQKNTKSLWNSSNSSKFKAKSDDENFENP